MRTDVHHVEGTIALGAHMMTALVYGTVNIRVLLPVHNNSSS